MRVALIGIGNMGKPMGRNMLKAGHSVTGYDLVPDAVQYLVEFGGKAASSAAEAAVGAEIVMSMLPTHDHVRNVYLGKAGLLAEVSAGTLFVDSSTISISVTRELSTEVKKRRMLPLRASNFKHHMDSAHEEPECGKSARPGSAHWFPVFSRKQGDFQKKQGGD